MNNELLNGKNVPYQLDDLAEPDKSELSQYEPQLALPRNEEIADIPYFQKLLSHPILTRERERELFTEMQNARRSYTETMMRVGLAALRVAQIGNAGARSPIPYTMLRRSFNQNPPVIMQSAGNVVPEVYELVYASRSALSATNSYSPQMLRRLEDNSDEQAQLLLPWKAGVQTLEDRLRGDEHNPGLLEYARKITSWIRQQSRSSLKNLYNAVAYELGLAPEAFLELLKDILTHRECYHEKVEQATLSNQRLVLSLAYRQQRRLPYSYNNLKDLFSIGNQGLQKGIERFEIERGYRFSTYAAWWIKQAIDRELKNTGAGVRLPVYIQERISRVNRAVQELQQEGDDEKYFPTTEEIAGITGLTEEQVERALSASRGKVVSLDAPIESHGRHAYGGSSGDDHRYELFQDTSQPDPSDEAHALLVRHGIDNALSTLTERERTILTLRFGLADGVSRTLKETGHEYKITRERVRQIEAKALRKLRHPRKLALLEASAEDLK